MHGDSAREGKQEKILSVGQAAATGGFQDFQWKSPGSSACRTYKPRHHTSTPYAACVISAKVARPIKASGYGSCRSCGNNLRLGTCIVGVG